MPSPTSPPQRSLRVLVVENHADTLTMIKQVLEWRGHQVETATAVKDALEKLQEPSATFDVLLSDIGLPDGDGWDLLRQIRPPKNLYAVAISGYGTATDRKNSREAGYRQHLIKPLTIQDLEMVLDNAAVTGHIKTSHERALQNRPV